MTDDQTGGVAQTAADPAATSEPAAAPAPVPVSGTTAAAEPTAVSSLDVSSLPVFTSHKQVRAARLVNAPLPNGDGGFVLDNGYLLTTAELAKYHRSDYTPVVGDALVVYEGDYRSICPQKAFEDGYSLGSGGDHVAALRELHGHAVSLYRAVEHNVEADILAPIWEAFEKARSLIGTEVGR